MELTYSNKDHKRIVYILDDTVFLFYRWFHDTAVCGSLMKPPNSKLVSGNVPPCCFHILCINIYVHYELITACYVLLPQIRYLKEYNLPLNVTTALLFTWYHEVCASPPNIWTSLWWPISVCINIISGPNVDDFFQLVDKYYMDQYLSPIWDEVAIVFST